jgi:hypothetical protein
LSDGLRDPVEQTLVGMEGELVEFDVTALASEGVGIGGDAVDAATIGKFEDAGGNILVVIEDNDAEINGGEVEEVGPVFAVLKVEFGLGFVAGGNPDIEERALPGDEENGVVGVGVGDADLAGFLDDFERGEIEDPVGLEESEVVVHWLNGSIKNNLMFWCLMVTIGVYC